MDAPPLAYLLATPTESSMPLFFALLALVSIPVAWEVHREHELAAHPPVVAPLPVRPGEARPVGARPPRPEARPQALTGRPPEPRPGAPDRPPLPSTHVRTGAQATHGPGVPGSHTPPEGVHRVTPDQLRAMHAGRAGAGPQGGGKPQPGAAGQEGHGAAPHARTGAPPSGVTGTTSRPPRTPNGATGPTGATGATEATQTSPPVETETAD